MSGKNKIILLILFWGILYPFFSLESFSEAASTVKKGVAGNGATGSPSFMRNLTVSWYYEWSLAPSIFDAAASVGIEAVPDYQAGSFGMTETELIRNVNEIVDNPANPLHQRRGIYWIVGNEPDRTDSEASDGWHLQINGEPDINALAEKYALMVRIIKTKDPTAKIIFGGVSRLYDFPNKALTIATALKNRWPQTQNRQGRQLKDDIAGWHIHYYGCCSWALSNNPPRDMDFEDRVQQWKTWQTANGGGETWLTEFGSPPGYTNDINMIGRLMTATTNYIIAQENTANRIDRFAWFSYYPAPPWITNLINSDGSLTTLGFIYKDIIPYRAPSPTLTPTSTPTLTPTPTCGIYETVLSVQKNCQTNSVVLTWDPVDRVTGYRVFRSKKLADGSTAGWQCTGIAGGTPDLSPNATNWTDQGNLCSGDTLNLDSTIYNYYIIPLYSENISCQTNKINSNEWLTCNVDCPRGELGNLNCGLDGRGGEINVDDLNELLLSWGSAPNPPAGHHRADIAHGNGKVNVDDLNKLLMNWGSS